MTKSNYAVLGLALALSALAGCDKGGSSGGRYEGKCKSKHQGPDTYMTEINGWCELDITDDGKVTLNMWSKKEGKRDKFANGLTCSGSGYKAGDPGRGVKIADPSCEYRWNNCVQGSKIQLTLTKNEDSLAMLVEYKGGKREKSKCNPEDQRTKVSGYKFTGKLAPKKSK